MSVDKIVSLRFFVKKSLLYDKNCKKNAFCGRIACFRRKSFLCLYTVLLYRLTGKLINYYRKPSQLRIVQWRATPSGSFREPVDYKGQEPSNLVFSEFRRSLLCSKTFFVYCPVRWLSLSPGYCFLSTISKGTLTETPRFIISVMLGYMRSLKLSQLRCGI